MTDSTEFDVTCIACQKTYYYKDAFIERPTDTPGTVQHGLQCPHCRFFFHTHYMDDALRRKRNDLVAAVTIHTAAKTTRTWNKYQAIKKEFQAMFEALNPRKTKEA